jgi:hypothetical protein
MNRHLSRARVLACAATLLAWHSAPAVNLLSNGTFRADVSSWVVEDPGDATAAFNAADANGAAGSGSIVIANLSAGPSNGTGIAQCVNTVTAGRVYTYGGKVLFPTGQARTGNIGLGLRWWSGANCTGQPITQPRLNVNAPAATWVSRASGPEVAPTGTVSAQFIAYPSKVEAGGQLVGQFDDLFLDDGLAAANYQGLWWAYPGGSESGWGINFADDGNVIFATWFTYDVNGLAVWYVVAANMTGPGVYSGTLYSGTGPAFSAMPWNPAQVAPVAVGTATLTFADFNRATFAYTVGAVSQQKEITRQVFAAPVPTCFWNASANLAAATNFQGMWWAAPAASESGWGININHQGNTLFGAWFTFGPDGKPTWMVVAATMTAPGVYTGDLYTGTGSPFNAPFDPSKIAPQKVGTATFTFANGNAATFAYVVNSVSQSKPITREVFNPAGTVCSN